ncbi:hypothetical protein TNCT_579811 [Trichonephila clavata]|uniref:Uncharacterized protein n=1 Tax=Trichonephila clavata TaxID=2740835 RepID=A0A8X6LGV0_TRICU|nr:hypothetical protein TNCT_579811 [Trichonephila clavata]
MVKKQLGFLSTAHNSEQLDEIDPNETLALLYGSLFSKDFSVAILLTVDLGISGKSLHLVRVRVWVKKE